MVGLFVLVYSIIEAPTYGWTATRTLGGSGCRCRSSWRASCSFELRPSHPMLDPRIFSHRRLAAGSLSIFVQFFAFFGFIFVVLQYLQLVRGDSALRLGRVDAADGRHDDADSARLAPMLVARVGSQPSASPVWC